MPVLDETLDFELCLQHSRSLESVLPVLGYLADCLLLDVFLELVVVVLLYGDLLGVFYLDLSQLQLLLLQSVYSVPQLFV